MKNNIDGSEPTQTETGTIRKAGKKRKFTAIDRILLVLATLMFLGAMVLFAWTPVQNYLRDQRTKNLISSIEEGNPTIIVKMDELPINGEEYESYETFVLPTAEGTDPQPTLAPIDLPEDVVLTAFGMIKIEKIDLYIPLLDDAGVVPLRYGAGIQVNTALPGEEGNSVILGHRMKAYGSLFNRLDEVAIGDTIEITKVDGTVITYIVDEVIPKLDPAELLDYIDINAGYGVQVTLVTCTPTGVGSHRLLVIGHMA